MPSVAEILREIHRFRRHAKDLQSEVERIPRLLKGGQAKVNRQEQELKDAQDKLKQLKVRNLEKEGELKQTQGLIGKHEQQMNSASSKKEYDAFKVEIANDKKKCQEIEDQILTGMLEVDERAAQIPQFEKALKQAKAEQAKLEKESAERMQTLTEQLKQAQQSIKEVEATLPETIRPVYERMVYVRGEDAMSAVHNKTCVACYTEITAQNYNDLLTGQFVPCKSCGRILYLPE